MLTYEQAIALWNEQADEFNSWESLSDEEKFDWAVKLTVDKCLDICGDNGEDHYHVKFIKRAFGRKVTKDKENSITKALLNQLSIKSDK